MALTQAELEELELLELEEQEAQYQASLKQGGTAPVQAAEASPQPKTQTSQPAQAALEGFGQGATLGYLPQLQAMAEPGITKVLDLLTGQNQYAELPGYVERRDQNVKRQGQLADSNPWSYGGGNIAGSLATGVALPGGAAMKGAGIVGKTLAGGATGAALSFAANPGDVEGEFNPLQLGERMDAAETGATLGVAAPLAIGATSKVLAPAIKKISQRMAFKQLGPTARDALKTAKNSRQADVTQSLVDEGLLPPSALQEVGTSAATPERIGQTLMDEGILNGMPRGWGNIARRAGVAKFKAGKEVEGVLDDLGAAEQRLRDRMRPKGPNIPYEDVNVVMDDMAEQAQKQVQGNIQKNTSLPGRGQQGQLPTMPKEMVPKGQLPQRQSGGLQARAQQGIGEFSEEIQPGMRDVGGSGPSARTPGREPKWDVRMGINRQQIANELRSDLLTPDLDIPGAAARNRKITQLINQFEQGGDDVIPILKAEAKKRATGDRVNWNRLPDADIPLEEQVNRRLYGKLKTGVEDAADFLEKTVDGPSANRFRSAKDKFQDLAIAEKISGAKGDRQFSLRSVSPSDYGAGIGGLLLGGMFAGEDATWGDRVMSAALGGTLGAGNRAMRMYGNSVLAPNLNRASRVLEKARVPNNPWVLPALMRDED